MAPYPYNKPLNDFGRTCEKKYARTYKLFFMYIDIFMYHLEPILPKRGDENDEYLDEYQRQ